jgi:hypothetical protein
VYQRPLLRIPYPLRGRSNGIGERASWACERFGCVHGGGFAEPVHDSQREQEFACGAESRGVLAGEHLLAAAILPAALEREVERVDVAESR